MNVHTKNWLLFWAVVFVMGTLGGIIGLRYKLNLALVLLAVAVVSYLFGMVGRRWIMKGDGQ